MDSILLKNPRVVSAIGILGLIGYATDALIFPMVHELLILKFFSFSLTALALGYHIIAKPKAEISLSLFAITLLFHLTLAPFLQINEPGFASFYMRNSLIFWVIMPALGFTIHKKMFYFSTFIYLVQFGIVLYISQDSFLLNTAVTIILMLICYVYVIMYLLKTLEESRDKTNSLIRNLKAKNIELNDKQKELKALVKTKDKLFSIMAHDLRSPFMGITGLSQMIKNSASKGSTDNIVEYSTMISDTAMQTHTLFSNLLEWAACQTGELVMKPEIIDLDDIVNETISLLKEHQQKKEITVEKLNTDISIHADPNGLKTILRNLLSNALKFTPSKGNIKITTKKKEDETVISISDSGVGIAEHQISNLFNMGSYISTIGTFKEKGTGIGLTICKEMIERHNGKIWVESEPEKGTTFHFSIPNKKKAS